jgi:small-conductance mechanosensitive channel
MVFESVTRGLDEVVEGIGSALPRLALAAIVVVLAYVGIKLAVIVLRSVLDRGYEDEEGLVVDLLVTVAGTLMWFAVALVVLDILGMGQIAASLGTATGFVALGVAYALSDMIADTVAGVYLLRDPDFNAGYTVEAAGIEGVVRSIELRKTRFDVGGETVVVANSKVEKEWRLIEDGQP